MLKTELDELVSKVGQVIRSQLAPTGAEFMLIITAPPDPGPDRTATGGQWRTAASSNMKPEEAIRCLEAGLRRLRG